MHRFNARIAAGILRLKDGLRGAAPRTGWAFAAGLFMAALGALVLAANAGRFPKAVENLYDFPGGDKAGHALLFGILSYLVNRGAWGLFPRREPMRVMLAASLALAFLIGLEEASQALFPARTPSLADLFASYLGVLAGALLAGRAAR